MNTTRLQKLTQKILDHGLDGMALMPGPNMLYISGIHAHISERPILLFIPADDDPAIIIPSLEAAKARAVGIPDSRIFAWSDDEGYTRAFQQASAQLELGDYLLGIEELHMRVLEYEMLQRYAPGLNMTHAESVIGELRSVKDNDEVAAMRRATAVAEAALEELLPRIKVGMTEKQIAALLMQELVNAGAHSFSFNPIIAGGPNSALPHATPTDRPIRNGEFLLIDWGAVIDDYPSDITRTFQVGDLDPELERVYDAVRRANEAGKAAARPGVTGEQVDRAARKVIADAGYGEQFIHRTGHGLGLEVHETPNMVEGNSTPLIPGNVFTVEPGIYLPGRGGVRIEDNIVVTADGSLCLTNISRELIRVG
jgi:Xaa-Pro dipeptidase